MYNCPYCKEQIEQHWLYCRSCGKPLITNVEKLISERTQQPYEEKSFFYTDRQSEEVDYDINIIKDEEIENKLSEIDLELNKRESRGELMGDLLLNKASLHYKKRDLATALKNLELALQNFLEEKNFLKVAISHNEIGLIHEENGYFDQAIYHFDRSLSLLKDINDNHKIIQVLNNLGNVYYLIKDLEHSYECYQNALNIAEKENLDVDAVKSASNLVEILFLFKEYDRIAKILKNNSEFFEKNQDFYGIIQTLIKYGKLYYFLGQDSYDQSYQNLNHALNLIMKIEDQISVYLKARLEWECYLYLGKLYLLWDNDIEAEDYLLKSLESIRTYEIQESVKEGIVLETLAKLYSVKGEDNKSIEYYKFAIEIYNKYGDKAKIAELNREIGKIFQNFIQNVSEAIDYYQKALNIYEELNYIKDSAEILKILGDLHIEKNMESTALDYFQRARSNYKEIKDEYNINILTEKIKSLVDPKNSDF